MNRMSDVIYDQMMEKTWPEKIDDWRRDLSIGFSVQEFSYERSSLDVPEEAKQPVDHGFLEL